MEEESTHEVCRGTTEDLIDLPPGFRFHPTDEEIITHYLTEKVKNSSFSASAVGEVDLNKCEPWDLPQKAKMGEKEWYFFCQRDRKYPTGMRTNRATEAGYWKATGKDKEIYKGKSNSLVGMKKTLVFYRGRAPKGEKSNWVMHEFRLEGQFSYYSLPRTAKDEWVVCRVFHKSVGMKKTSIHDLLRMNSFGDHDFLDYSTLPPLMEDPPNYTPSSSTFNDASGRGDHDTNTNDFKTSRISSSDHGNYLHNFSTPNGNNIVIHNHNFAQQPSNNTTTRYQTPPPNIFYHPQIPTSSHPLYSTLQTSPSVPQGPPYLHHGRNMISAATANYPFDQNFQNVSAGGGFDHGSNHDQTLSRALAESNETTKELRKQCKVEQLSSNHQSMVSLSQDTGISTDMNTTAEISSKHEIVGSSLVYEDLHNPSSVGPIGDLDCLWDDY